MPATVIVKSDGLAVPPPALITLLVTTISPVVIGGGVTEYVLVMMHSLVSPSLMLPEHPLDSAES